jgi:heptosyltransferase-1
VPATLLPLRYAAPIMQRVLIIRSSSLGDIVHALPVVHDMRRHCPDLLVDWVAEEPFAALVRLNHGVRRVVPVALRRWRHRILSRATWREAKAFRGELAHERYDAVIDLQEQVKGALIAWLAHGPVHGPDHASAHEAMAALFYRHRHRIDARQPLLLRCRRLAGQVLGYEPEGAPRFDLSPPTRNGAPVAPYVVCLHGTSQDEKLWPETHWRTLLEHFAHTGTSVVLPWGNRAEADRSERLAAGLPGVTVPSWRALPELAAMLAGAQRVIGVDTGPTHLAAALGRPTLALFTATDPHYNGTEPSSTLARDLGGPGDTPGPAAVIAAAEGMPGVLPVA